MKIVPLNNTKTKIDMWTKLIERNGQKMDKRRTEMEKSGQKNGQKWTKMDKRRTKMRENGINKNTKWTEWA